MERDQARDSSEPGPLRHFGRGLRAEALRRVRAVEPPVLLQRSGRVIGAAGRTLLAAGLPEPLGSRVTVLDAQGGTPQLAEVTGYGSTGLVLLPYASGSGIARGARVVFGPLVRTPNVGFDLVGRIMDGEGCPLDGGGPIRPDVWWPLEGRRLNPMRRRPVAAVMDCGVRSVNALATLGTGMRIGLFAGAGVGKSTLLGMMARHADADIVVVALIGERGREVREFVDGALHEALRRAVVVAEPADGPAISRVHAAWRASAIAEFFRARGRHVLLLVDSITRLAMAWREIGLARGEPPAMRGYPASAFTLVSAYLERAGQGGEGEGSITGLYTVLVEGGDLTLDPIADTARATLDGHIVLSRRAAEAGIYPAFDPEASLSRVMDAVVDDAHRRAARRFRTLWSRLQQKRDLVDIGAYKTGADPILDIALKQRDAMERLLRQMPEAGCSYADSTASLQQAIAGPTPPPRATGAAREA